ncbi:HAD-IIB family hydrolase [Dubosiella newyorkensis]|uniref:HAD-IIB family hydrolase n=1 Tax=Dubosiella newyorkensis TaxID=1862672 RepID=UPI0023F421E9|nr:HAD-IIB family hydrolase [Dubosiella newyorkensis]
MKLLASDFDGTLNYGDTIMEEDLEAIKAWKEAGNEFVIVTGRSYESLKKQLDRYDLPVDYVVSNNGGMIYDGSGKELMANYLDTITAVDILYAMHEIPDVASYVVNNGKQRYKIVVDPNVSEHRYPSMQPTLSEEKVLDLGQYAQLVISMGNQMDALELANQINHFFGSTITAYPNNFVVDIVPKGVSKGSGMDFVLTYSSVDDDSIYAIGDSYNDIPLLEQVENSYAIATAPEEVQEVASETVSSISELIQKNM